MTLELKRNPRLGHLSNARGLTCTVANDLRSFHSAFRLIYKSYTRDRLSKPNAIGLRFLPHQLLDSSSVLSVCRKNRILGTLSLIEDGELGLPIELLYPTEVAKLRHRRRRVAELTCLALLGHEATPSFSTLRSLWRTALQIAVDRSVDFITVCVHPRFARFYERRLQFDLLGQVKRCPWVCAHPAVAMFRRVGTPAGAMPHDGAVNLGHVADMMRKAECREYFSQWITEASPLPSIHCGLRWAEIGKRQAA